MTNASGAMLLPNLVQVTESISGSVVPLAMFEKGVFVVHPSASPVKPGRKDNMFMVFILFHQHSYFIMCNM